jgi:hypothetical protein
MLSPLPRHSDGRCCLARSIPSYQPSPKGSSGRPVHLPFRGLLGVHSRYGLHTRAVTIFRGTLHRRLQRLRYLHRCSGCFRLEHFAGWAFHPLEQHRLFTAHTQSRSRLRGQDIYLPNAWELKARFCQAALDAHKALKMAAHISAIVLNHPYLLN